MELKNLYLIFLFLINFNLLYKNYIVDFFKNLFPQVNSFNNKYFKQASRFVKNIEYYDKLNSVCSFSAIVLSDELRMIYLDYYSEIHFLDSIDKSLAKEKLLTDNENYITFYVLASQPVNNYESNYSLFSGSYFKNNHILGGKNPEWKVFLNCNNDKIFYIPEDIKITNLPLEYKAFFGDLYNQFKFVYIVRFAAKNEDYEKILMKNKNINLIFKSNKYKVKLHWKNI